VVAYISARARRGGQTGDILLEQHGGWAGHLPREGSSRVSGASPILHQVEEGGEGRQGRPRPRVPTIGMPWYAASTLRLTRRDVAWREGS
jgi:hypothetical protein